MISYRAAAAMKGRHPGTKERNVMVPTATEAPAASRQARPLAEAAKQLDLTANALRQRFRRGSVDGYKDAEGRLFIYVDGVADSGKAAPDTAPPPPPDTAEAPDPTALAALTAEIRQLGKRLEAQEAAMRDLLAIHRTENESTDSTQAAVHALAQNVETLTENVRTLGAGFRLHCQEVDRLTRLVNKLANGSASGGALTPPPAHRQRMFGRKQTDTETDENRPAETNE